MVSGVLLSHGLLRSTIGARGLNFWVRNGTRCTSPAMAADQRRAFSFQAEGRRVPWGLHSATHETSRKTIRPGMPMPSKGREELDRLVPLDSTPRDAYICGLSTSWSTRGLTEKRTHLGTGFPLRCFQRLSEPDTATGRCRWSTTRAPEVRPPRSSRTRGSLPQFSCAHGG